MKGRKIWALLLTAMMTASLLAGCGGSSIETAAAVENAAAMDMAEEQEVLYSSSTSESGAVTTEQKLIKRVNISAETEDLDTLLTGLGKKISELGGYIESQELFNGSAYSSYRSRSAYMTVRIPADKLSDFVGEVQGQSNVVSLNESQDDVTLKYVDTQSRMNALQAEQERLLELMGKAETMSDLLEVEQRLTEVRYELESVTSQMRVLENQVSYATVELYIDQVKVYTEVEEPSVGQRIASGFSRNLENIGEGLVDFFVWFVTYSPQLVFWALVIAAAVMLGKRAARKQKEKKMPPYYPPESDGEEKK